MEIIFLLLLWWLRWKNTRTTHLYKMLSCACLFLDWYLARFPFLLFGVFLFSSSSIMPFSFSLCRRRVPPSVRRGDEPYNRALRRRYWNHSGRSDGPSEWPLFCIFDMLGSRSDGMPFWLLPLSQSVLFCLAGYIPDFCLSSSFFLSLCVSLALTLPSDRRWPKSRCGYGSRLYWCGRECTDHTHGQWFLWLIQRVWLSLAWWCVICGSLLLSRSCHCP